MCQKNDLPLSLKSDTFNALCSDFDQILRSTLNGMEETEQDVAEINVKVKITLTPDSAPDFSVKGGQQTRSITKPMEHPRYSPVEDITEGTAFPPFARSLQLLEAAIAGGDGQ